MMSVTNMNTENEIIFPNLSSGKLMALTQKIAISQSRIINSLHRATTTMIILYVGYVCTVRYNVHGIGSI